MKNQIKRITILTVFTLCVSLTAIAQIKIGGAKTSSDIVRPNIDVTAPLPSEGNAISGQIELRKEFLNRAYSTAEVRRALRMGATVSDGAEQPGGIFPAQPTKAVGRVRSLQVRETAEAFYAEYTLDQLPADQRITAWAKLDSGLVKSCGGGSGIAPTTAVAAVSGGNRNWDGIVSFATDPRRQTLARSYHFALFRTCLR